MPRKAKGQKTGQPESTSLQAASKPKVPQVYLDWDQGQPCDKCQKTDHEFEACLQRPQFQLPCKRCGHGFHILQNCPFSGTNEPKEINQYTPNWHNRAVQSSTLRAGPSAGNTSTLATSSAQAPAQPKTTSNPTNLTKAEEREKARAAEKKRRLDLKSKIADSEQAGWLYPRKSNNGNHPSGAREIEVLANSFVVTVKKDVVYKYRIVIGKIPMLPDPRAKDPKKIETKRAMIRSLMEKWPGVRYASDFNSIVLTTEKLFDHTDTDVEKSIKKIHQRTGRPPRAMENIESEVKFEKLLPIEDLLNYLKKNAPKPHNVEAFKEAAEVLAMLNIVSWQKVQSVETTGKIKKKFYPAAEFDRTVRNINGLKFKLDGCFYARFGFFSSLRVGDLNDNQVLLNVNTTTSVFFEELSVSEWLELDASKDPQRWMELFGLKVTIPGPPNARVLSDIQQLDFKTFKRDPNSKDDKAPATEKETVKEHLQKRGRLSGSFWYVNVGNEQHPDWYDSSVVQIKPFQPYGKKFESRDMVSGAERSPQNNKDLITDKALPAIGITAANANYSWTSNDELKGMCIFDIAKKFVKCKACLLPVPSIVYGPKLDRELPSVSEGWSNLGQTFWKPKAVKEPLFIIYLSTGQGADGRLDNSIKNMIAGLRGNGIEVGGQNQEFKIQREVVPRSGNLRENIKDRLDDGLRKLKGSSASNPPLIMVIITNRDQNAYSSIKWWGDCCQGIPTICVQQQKLLKNDGKIWGNLSLKFNLKLGGTSHDLGTGWDPKFKNTMIMGADVTHPGRDGNCPSLAAVVATYSTKPELRTHYLGSARMQKARTEYIDDLEGMVRERLTYWKAENGKLPENILFYRDGVSESQFEMVKNLEYIQIQKAFDAVAGLSNAKVKITLLVVTKRHHTRFFPVEDVTGIEKREERKQKKTFKDKNIRSGLVVDTKVVDRNNFSFYLQSHHSELGTAKNAHYFVIQNGMELSASDLWTFTFNLCYTSAKALTPLSVCPPARYADLLCERLRCYVRPALDGPSWHTDNPTLTEKQNLDVWSNDSRIWGSSNTRPNPWHPDLPHMFYL